CSTHASADSGARSEDGHPRWSSRGFSWREQMSNYWTKRVPRRRVIRGASFAGLGLAGAAIIGCSGDDDTGSGSGTGTATATGTGTAVAGGSVAPGEAKTGGELILTGSDLQKLDFQATISTPQQ